MKVLEINAVVGIGSTGSIVKDIGDMLKNNGDEVRYAYQVGKCNINEGYKVGNKLDWKLHALYTRLTGKQGFASKLSTKKLLKYIDKEKPDIVHLHNLHANYINLPLLLNYLGSNNIPTVVTLHDCWFFTGKCCHFDHVKCDKWKDECGHCPKLKESPKSILFDNTSYIINKKKELFSNINNLTVVGCSKWISDLARESSVFKNANVTQINNGVDKSIFKPLDRDFLRNKLNIADKFVILGIANKWLDEKNKEVFNNVCSNIKSNEILLFVGCDEEQKQHYKNNKNIMAIEFIKDRNELAEYYNIADVFVNLTFEDTLPTVNMEALCCGTPVITYDSCGSPELVQNNKTGYIIEQLDINQLHEALESIKNNKISRNDCYKNSLVLFDKNNNYKEYLKLFKSLIKE